jgi:hypothetical protein
MLSKFDPIATTFTQAQSDTINPPKLYVPQIVSVPLFLWL